MIRYRSLGVVGLLALGALAFAQTHKANEILLKVKPGQDVVAAAAHAQYGAVELSRNSKIGWARVKLPTNRSSQQGVSYYRSKSFVAGVSLNPIPKLLDTPDDPQFASQWHHPVINTPEAWDLQLGNPAVSIAILDTGVDLTHPDLAAKMLPGTDPGDGDNDPTDEHGHGTHCAGIAAAATNNGIGVAGAGRDCMIMPVKVFGSRGGIALVDGIIWATDNGAKVISMSLKISDFQALRDAINYALSNGVFVVAAAGNDGNTAKNYPASYPGVMAVASSTPDDSRSGFSTYGNWVHVAAPGSSILSTFPGGNYGNSSGTSMACPMVAGVAGLVWSQGGPTITNTDVFNTICNTTDPVPGDYVIFGRINAERAVNNTRIIETSVLFAGEAEVFVGTHLAGGLPELEQGEGNMFALQTTVVPRVSSQGGVDLKFTLDRPASELFDFRLTVRGQSTATSTGMVWIYNVATEQWEFKKAFPLKTTLTTFALNFGDDMSNYVNENDEVFVRVRSHIMTSRRGGRTPFNFMIDQANLEASYEVLP